MAKKTPLQVNLFSGDFVNTRTRKQKKIAAQQAQPKQTEMFSQREMAQFGVNPRPLIPISPKTRIELALQDMRTEEEKEAAIQREAEKRNYRLFDEEALAGGDPDGEESIE